MKKENTSLLLGFGIVIAVTLAGFAVITVGKSVGFIPKDFLAPKQVVIPTNDSGLSSEQETASKDSDNDGLIDLVEAKLGTNTLNPDTDGDGYTDGEEVRSSHDPLVASKTPKSQATSTGTTNASDDFSKDTDGDTLSDGTEKVLGTDPTKKDTDGDGYNDAEEVNSKHDPLKANTAP